MGSLPNVYNEFKRAEIKKTEAVISGVLYSFKMLQQEDFEDSEVKFLTAVYLKFKDKEISSRELRFNTFAADQTRYDIVKHLSENGLLEASRDSYKLSVRFLDTFLQVQKLLDKIQKEVA